MPWNDDVASEVQEELAWDPKVDSTTVAVSADEGTITLRGTVGSLREKREAATVAARVFGVVGVDNQLQVRRLNGERRGDAEIRADVLRALMLDSLVPSTVDAKVEDGFVTLTGRADYQYQRDEADRVVSSIVGALELFDEIELTHPVLDREAIAESIRHSFERNAKVSAHKLSVSTKDGTVTLRGSVDSWATRDAALEAARSTPGVTKVEDHITVDDE
jgi:osmotically-inducible protein OsmY